MAVGEPRAKRALIRVLSVIESPRTWPTHREAMTEIARIARRWDRSPIPFACAKCGTTKARTYVVTTLDRRDPKHTQTEICLDCHEAMKEAEDAYED